VKERIKVVRVAYISYHNIYIWTLYFQTLRGHKNANYESKFTNEIRNCFGFNAWRPVNVEEIRRKW